MRGEFPGAALDRWLTTDPREDDPRCPECMAVVESDGYDGWDCLECGWSKAGPDPDRAYDEMRDRELLDDWGE
jgi:tRNA(Ile2) C34 agmatinyltransferase TiaS